MSSSSSSCSRRVNSVSLFPWPEDGTRTDLSLVDPFVRQLTVGPRGVCLVSYPPPVTSATKEEERPDFLVRVFHPKSCVPPEDQVCGESKELPSFAYLSVNCVDLVLTLLFPFLSRRVESQAQPTATFFPSSSRACHPKPRGRNGLAIMLVRGEGGWDSCLSGKEG